MNIVHRCCLNHQRSEAGVILEGKGGVTAKQFLHSTLKTNNN